jgi:tetratricopeptide (TPR) repeat protein
VAEAYEAVSDTPKAVDFLRRAIVQNPKVARYYVDFADIALVHASYQAGIDMLNFGLKQLPDAAQLYLARGILYAQTGQYQKSEEDFAKADQLDPHTQEVAEAQGLVALEQSNLAEGEQTIRARIRTSPRNAFLYYLLAETLTRKGAPVGTPAFRDALQAAQEAVRLQPNFALARDVLGRLYLQEGKNSEAIEQSRMAVRYDPSDQTAVYHLILALRKGNKPDEIPALMRQLTQLREQARRKEAEERKYALVEGSGSQTR